MDQLENLFSTKMIVRSIINVCLDENEFPHWSRGKREIIDH